MGRVEFTIFRYFLIFPKMAFPNRKLLKIRLNFELILVILLGLVGVLMSNSTLMLSALTGFFIIRSSADKMLHWGKFPGFSVKRFNTDGASECNNDLKAD